MTRTDERYVRSLERRIKNQRAQLRWFHQTFERGGLRSRSSGWPASRVYELLKRLGSPHRVDDQGKLCRRITVKRNDRHDPSKTKPKS